MTKTEFQSIYRFDCSDIVIVPVVPFIHSRYRWSLLLRPLWILIRAPLLLLNKLWCSHSNSNSINWYINHKYRWTTLWQPWPTLWHLQTTRLCHPWPMVLLKVLTPHPSPPLPLPPQPWCPKYHQQLQFKSLIKSEMTIQVTIDFFLVVFNITGSP